MTTRPTLTGARVVSVLQEHLPTFDQSASDVICRWVDDYLANPYPQAECIVDSPITANWRLKPAGGGLRLADYSLAGRKALCDWINSQLGVEVGNA